jgi:hypothetical protein
MRQPFSAIALVLGTLVTGPALAVELVDSAFQVSFSYAGEDQVLDGAVVPLLPDNACYSWYIRLAAGEAPDAATEILSLPVGIDWGELATDPDDGIDISADGKVATRMFKPELDPDGWFSNSWCAVEGDPVGPHRIEVSIGDETIATYDFQVVPPEDYTWPSIYQPQPRERSVDDSW